VVGVGYGWKLGEGDVGSVWPHSLTPSLGMRGRRTSARNRPGGITLCRSSICATFADDNEQIRSVMPPGDRTLLQNIGDAASVRCGDYTVIDQEGQQGDSCRAGLSPRRGECSAAWREVAAGVWPLSDEHRGSVPPGSRSNSCAGRAWRNSMSELASHALLLDARS